MTKKIMAIVLAMTMMFSSMISVFAEETDSDHFSSEYGENLLEYLQGEDGKRLILRTNYGYMSFVEKFNSDVLSLYLFNMADLLIDSGAKPDKEKYMEVLINIIATYDLDNADDISKQKQLDNLKGIEDYAMDCAKMGANAVSVMAGTSPATTELENAISTAVDGMSVLIDNTDNWISALSNLETVVQDYSVHYEFLEIIEKNSNDNNLKEAASTLREGMSKAMKIKLDTYSEISNENFENYKEFFFTDVFFEVAKQTAEYESDETLSFFVDSGDSIVSSMDVLGDSWELGTMIGTLVGNVVAGGENLINRVLEMMAIYDVSIILQDYLIDTQDNFLSNIGNEEEESYLNKYMSFSQYLIGCRIRGEYCLYSIVANDAGLLNWFNKESAEEAKEWYDNKVEKIINIQKSLLSIKDNTMNEKYIKVIEKYINSAPWEWPCMIQIDEINVDCELYSKHDLDTVGYVLKDIDNNGVDELLVGPADNNGEIYTAFSLVDGDLVLLFMSWSRNHHYLLDSGNVLNNGSGGAFLSVWYNEAISDNKRDMVIQDGVITDGIYAESIGAKDPWFKATTSDTDDYVNISEQKARDTIDSWEGSKVHIDYIPLSKYTNQDTDNKVYSSNVIQEYENEVYYCSSEGSPEYMGLPKLDFSETDLGYKKLPVTVNGGIQSFVIYNDYIYYIGGYENKNDSQGLYASGTLYRCDLDGNNVKQIANEVTNLFFEIANNELRYNTCGNTSSEINYNSYDLETEKNIIVNNYSSAGVFKLAWLFCCDVQSSQYMEFDGGYYYYDTSRKVETINGEHANVYYYRKDIQTGDVVRIGYSYSQVI